MGWEFVLAALVVVSVDAGCIVTNQQCYVDDSERVLGHDNENQGGDSMNNEWCAQICHDLGNKVFGTQFGTECYCGNAVRANAIRAPNTECNMQCGNYPSEMCGGNWRIFIANVNCSGDPVPPPPMTPRLSNPCLNMSANFRNLPFCNPTLPLHDRIVDALSRMTIPEKIDALGTGGNMGSQGLGLRGYNWWSEAAHGIAMVRWTPTTPEASNFAFPITTAMSFNRSLWKATGQQIGREARAFMNAGNAYSTYWAPVINLARDPRWGRNIETPGEDPYLVGEYATYWVRGFQEAPEDPYHIQASACCKHYVANEMESSVEVGVHHWRNEFNAQVSIQDLMDSYMPPFQACVQKGRVTSLMCSYNAINGIPACANNWLLTEVARGEWGFDGYITSDCDADEDVYTNHKYTKTPEETVRAVLRAGTDVDCGSFVPQHAQSALNQGLITVQDIDTRLYELFKMRMRLGHFDPKSPLDNFPRTLICSAYAKELARDGVTQSVTLLKNDKNTLPLPRNTPSVVVIGPTNSNANNVAGYYGPDHPCGRVFSTVLDAVKQYVPSATYVPGVPNVDSGDLSGIAAAVTAARAADTVVLAVGTNLATAAEGHDTNTLDFSSGQAELIRQVTAAARKPVVVILLTAVPLDISALLSNANIGAILYAGQPSVQTLGLGDLLFGVRVPAGRMIQTIYPASYAHEVSIFDMGMRPGPSNYPRPDCPLRPASACPNGTNPGRTHRFYSRKPIVAFGFGLSYTTFRYTPIDLPEGPVSLAPVHRMLAETREKGRSFPHESSLELDEPLVAYRINVTNTGTVAADDVVLGFLVPPGGGTNGIPIQTLFAFERVRVTPGQTVSVFLYPSLLEFTQVNDKGAREAHAGEYVVRFGLAETEKLGQGYLEHKLVMV